MHGRNTPPAPLERGLRSVLWWDVRVGLRCFLRRCLSGLDGCFWFEVAMRGRDTPPAPLERGG